MVRCTSSFPAQACITSQNLNFFDFLFLNLIQNVVFLFSAESSRSRIDYGDAQMIKLEVQSGAVFEGKLKHHLYVQEPVLFYNVLVSRGSILLLLSPYSFQFQ